MSCRVQTLAVACVVAVVSGPNLGARTTALPGFADALAASASTANAPTQEARAVPVRIVGCVERMPAGTDPTRPVMFKLINTQAGPSVMRSGDTTSRPAQAPAVLDPEYLLAAAKPIEFAKHQNQRVEVTGITTRTNVPGANPAAQFPKQTLTVSDLRVIGTECK